MRMVKIKKRYYSDLAFMYHDLGLVKPDNSTSPDKVLISKTDLKKMEVEIRKKFRKQNSLYSKKRIDSAVQFHLCNLGPNDNVGAAIKPGYLIILD